MRNLSEYKNEIHSCSKCGLCQAVCPIYKITGNDCTVSRGHFIMLSGLIKGDLKMSKTINRYLNICLKCSACSKFCPSGIDVVDIIAAAKAEYFRMSKFEKLVSFFQKKILFGFLLRLSNLFVQKEKSKYFDKKVLYFGGCGTKIRGNKNVVKVMNAIGIEVISPDFDCCGMPFYVRGDLCTYEEYMNNFYSIIDKYGIKEVVTSCASCEKTIKSYSKFSGRNDIVIKNIFEYIKEAELKLKLIKPQRITFHKPCNMNNYEDVKQILDNIENLEYTEMDNYDKCCGLNGVDRFSEYKIMKKLFKEKHDSIIKSGAKTVLTSCLGCKAMLLLYSLGKYKVEDLTDFIAENIKN